MDVVGDAAMRDKAGECPPEMKCGGSHNVPRQREYHKLQRECTEVCVAVAAGDGGEKERPLRDKNCLRARYIPTLSSHAFRALQPGSAPPPSPRPSILHLLPNKPANPRVPFSLASNRNSFFSQLSCILACEDTVPH